MMQFPDSAPPKVLGAIRDETRSLHDDLERSVESHRLLEGPPDRAHYQRLLAAHGAMHRMVARHTEPDVLGPGVQFMDWPGCHRLAALDLDLRALGHGGLTRGDPAPMTRSIEPCTPVWRAFASGLLYVIEGSAHGNAVMLKALRQSAEFRSWNADQFLATSRDGLQQRWAGTLELLRTHGDPEPEHAVAGAVRGFEAFGEFWRAG